MKIKVYVERIIELEVDNPAVEQVVRTHQRNSLAFASEEDYQAAMDCIEKATGIPVLSGHTPLTSDHIVGAYREEDDVAVFEC